MKRLLNSEKFWTGLSIIPGRPHLFIIRRKTAGHAQTILLGGHCHDLRLASRQGPVPPPPPPPLSSFSRLIRFAVLLRLRCFAAAGGTQNFVAAARDLVHPHHVHDVQADAGADPGDAAPPGHQVKGFRAVDGEHATVVDRHDSDADQEKHRCHGDAVRHIGPRGLGVPEHFEEPAKTQHVVNTEGVQREVTVTSGNQQGARTQVRTADSRTASRTPRAGGN